MINSIVSITIFSFSKPPSVRIYIKPRPEFSFCIILVLILFCFSVSAQKDSLIQHHRNLLENKVDDTTYVKNIIDLGSAYFPEYPDSVYKMGQLAIKRSEHIDFCYGIVNGYSLKAMSFLAKNEIAEARPHYIEAESASGKCDFISYQAMFLRILGNIDFTLGDYASALNFWQIGIEKAEESEYFEAKVEMYSNIGKLYQKIQEFEQATEFFEKSYQESEKHNIVDLLPNALFTLSSIALLKKEYTDSKQYSRNLIQSADSIDKSRNFLPRAYGNLGDASLGLNQPDSALIYFLKMEESLPEIDPLYFGPVVLEQAELELGLGKSWLGLKEVENAIIHLEESYGLAKTNDLTDILVESNELLSSIAESKGNYKKALVYFKEFKANSDSIFNDKKLKELSFKEAEYQFQQKSALQDIELEKLSIKQKEQRVIILILSLLSILIILTAFLLFRVQRLKTEKVEFEQKAIQRDLDYKNRELTSNVLSLLKKNELLINISITLKKLLLTTKGSQKTMVASVLQEIESSSKEVGWDEFELRFKEVHSNFYEKLNAKFENLTKNEQRLCAFLKMKMSTKEISSLTFQTPHSIDVARSRMKKKMGITDNERLVHFLSHL